MTPASLLLSTIGCDLVLPFPPALNTYYRHVGPKVLISEGGRLYRQRVWLAVRRALPGHQTLTGRLSVTIGATPPDKRKRDLDGMFKAVLDSLTHARLWEDDSQIDSLSITRGFAAKPGQLFVRVDQAAAMVEEEA